MCEERAGSGSEVLQRLKENLENKTRRKAAEHRQGHSLSLDAQGRQQSQS